MDVTGPGSIQGGFSFQRVKSAAKPASTESVSKTMAPVDQLDISEAGKLMSGPQDMSDITAERLAQIKAEIDAGTYDTPEKLETALMRMLNQITDDSETR